MSHKVPVAVSCVAITVMTLCAAMLADRTTAGSFIRFASMYVCITVAFYAGDFVGYLKYVPENRSTSVGETKS